jgi:hypothetical protein
MQIKSMYARGERAMINGYIFRSDGTLVVSMVRMRVEAG